MAKLSLLVAILSLVLGTISTNLPAIADDGVQLKQSIPNANQPPVESILTPQTLPETEKIRKDRWVAEQMAKSIWLDKAAAANPAIIEAICAHPGAAKILAQHRHLDKIAEADHYLCRRLTRWRGSTEKLLRNKWCDRVIALDPQGIYYDLKKHPQDARLLSKSTVFNQMVDENPDLAKEITKHMY